MCRENVPGVSPERGRSGPAWRVVTSLLLLLLLLLSLPRGRLLLSADGADARPRLAATAAAAGEEAPRAEVVLEKTYRRISLGRSVARVAVGDDATLGLELLDDREALVLGKRVGRTNIIVWYADGKVTEIRFSVERDLSLLEEALSEIDARIRIEVAPDREAIVLRGVVADMSALRAAEAAARSYLAAGGRGGARGRAAMPVVRAPGDGGAAEPSAPSTDATDDRLRFEGGESRRGEVINLLRVDSLPLRVEERILEAIQDIGGQHVEIRRVLRGDVRDDTADLFILEGRVPDQVALVRVLSVASRVLVGKELGSSERIEVIAEEGGELFQEGQGAGQMLAGGLGGGAGGLGGGQGGQQGGRSIGRNLIERNVARARALEAAGGRILSFIDVADLPQVRVDVRFYEVDRAAILQWGADLGVLASNFDQNALRPAAFAGTFQQIPARVGAGSGGTEIQNVLSSLGGLLGQQFQMSGENVAVDVAFRLLETKGLARRLSEPSLTVLSGEVAAIQVGGEVPVAEAFSPALGEGTTPGVFSTVRFRSFGIQLFLRPRVGERDDITVDLQPSVSLPDSELTGVLRQSTGTEQAATAFEVRSLRTSSRLRDGQSLVIGGLVTRGESRDVSQTPILGDIPLLGWLFREEERSEDDVELVIVVSPAVVRDPEPRAALWSFPTSAELLRGAGLLAGSDRDEPEESADPEDGDGDPAEVPTGSEDLPPLEPAGEDSPETPEEAGE